MADAYSVPFLSRPALVPLDVGLEGTLWQQPVEVLMSVS